MKYELMPFFRDFRDNVMDRREYELFRVQALGLAQAKERTGHFDKVLKMPKRVLVVNYYLSLKLETLFILTAHITRAGEPREKEVEAIKGYVSKIKNLEAE